MSNEIYVPDSRIELDGGRDLYRHINGGYICLYANHIGEVVETCALYSKDFLSDLLGRNRFCTIKNGELITIGDVEDHCWEHSADYTRVVNINCNCDELNDCLKCLFTGFKIDKTKEDQRKWLADTSKLLYSRRRENAVR